MSKTKQITEAIQKACPELMELSVGCEVEMPNDYKYGTSGVSPTHNDVFLGEQYRDEFFFSRYKERRLYQAPKKEIRKILGHPIHLEHVLRAIQKSRPIGHSYSITDNGMIDKETDGEYDQSFEYNLSLSFKENMENPDLRDFLWELLVKE